MIYCQRCGKQLPYNINKQYCDDCIKLRVKEKRKQYYLKNKVKYKEYNKQRYAENQENLYKIYLEYKYNNPDKFKNYTANYRNKNREVLNAEASQRRQTEQQKEYQKTYIEKNKEKKKEYDKQRWLSFKNKN